MMFTDDQLVTLIEFLESQRDAGYTLEQIIEELTHGQHFTISDQRVSRLP